MDEERSPNDIPLIPARIPPMVRGEVHVWCLSLKISEKEREYCLSLLSADEKVRADKYYFDTARQDFIAGRGLLRILLGRYLEIDPALLQFKYEAQSRPVLDQTWQGPPLQFNVSHSDGLGVIILSRSCRVGIDIEHVRPMADMDDLARRFFTQQESALIHSLSGSRKEEIFYKIWTCKEAYLKALGTGLLSPLDLIEIALEPGRISPLPNRNADGWRLEIFSPEPNYQGAIAIEGDAARIIFQPVERKDQPRLEMVGYSLRG